jgi:metallophosphoesterase superfamily enzyme
MVTLQASGHPLWLLPEGAAFLPEFDTLIVADAHLDGTDESLSVLSGLVRRLEATRIVFLGDFLQATLGEPAAFEALAHWRERHRTLELTLVRGQFGPRVAQPPAELDIQIFDEPLSHHGLALCHSPQPIEGAFVLAGRLYPCVSVRGRGNEWYRLPCFLFSPRLGVLPAFRSSADMQPVRPAKGQRIFALTANRVFELLPKRRAPKPLPDAHEVRD